MSKMTHKTSGQTIEVVAGQVAMYRTQGWAEKAAPASASANAAEKRAASAKGK